MEPHYVPDVVEPRMAIGEDAPAIREATGAHQEDPENYSTGEPVTPRCHPARQAFASDKSRALRLNWCAP